MFRKRGHYGQVSVTQGESRGGHHQNLQSPEARAETGWHRRVVGPHQKVLLRGVTGCQEVFYSIFDSLAPTGTNFWLLLPSPN